MGWKQVLLTHLLGLQKGLLEQPIFRRQEKNRGVYWSKGPLGSRGAVFGIDSILRFRVIGGEGTLLVEVGGKVGIRYLGPLTEFPSEGRIKDHPSAGFTEPLSPKQEDPEVRGTIKNNKEIRNVDE